MEMNLQTLKELLISEAPVNVILVTDAYTVGTGIMPSALNGGDIVSIPLDTEEGYQIGYILNEERKISPMTQDFISRLTGALKEL